MGNPATLILLLFVAALASAAVAPTDNFSCPPGYTRTDACSMGPCRCAIFQVLKIQTATTANANGVKTTDVWFNVTNVCPDAMYDVSFGIAGLTVDAPVNQYAGQNFGAWTVSIVDGTSSKTPTTPPIRWLRFSQNPAVKLYSNATGGSTWEIFKFTVHPYTASYLWTVQAHMGAKWDTFSGVDFSGCACPNCDGGAANRVISPCNLGYPDTGAPADGNPARAAVIFNENECLHSYAIVGSYLQMFYNDEHAMTLGMRALINGTTQTNYTFESMTQSTSYCVNFPNVGQLDFNPQDAAAAVDDATCPDGSPCGRPLYPALFITDITNDPNNRSGDWQYNGTALAPHRLCGVWKGVTKVINGGVCPSGTTTQAPYCTETDPPSNQVGSNWYLGAGSDPTAPCVAGSACTYQGWGAELAWNIDTLNLDPSHRYRFQFIVHDGDQNKPGGDVGQGCIVASAACPAGWKGTACAFCDTNPLPGDGSYQWFCYPTGNNGADAYQLIKVPTYKLSQPPYSTSGGFVIQDNYTDAQGYKVDCQCQRTIVSCPDSCCGGGDCNDSTGVCTCYDPANSDNETCCYTPPPGTTTAPPQTDANGTTIVPPPPCFNSGAFCSGHGRCNFTTMQCDCSTDNSTGTPITYTGQSCDTPVVPSNCVQYSSDCNTCVTNSSAANISCVWCNDGNGGSCFAESVCVTPIYSCDTTVEYTPEPCPDNCSYAVNPKNKKHPAGGICVNTTFLANSTDPSFSAQNGTNITVCVCFPGYSGINCGDNGGKGLSVAAIAGISAGVIAGIVIGALVCIGLVSYGTKKGVDYFYFDQKAFTNAHDNPLHVEATQDRVNALYTNGH